MGLAGPKLQPVRCSVSREAASHINTSSTCASLNGSVNIAASPPAYLFARKPRQQDRRGLEDGRAAASTGWRRCSAWGPHSNRGYIKEVQAHRIHDLVWLFIYFSSLQDSRFKKTLFYLSSGEQKPRIWDYIFPFLCLNAIETFIHPSFHYRYLLIYIMYYIVECKKMQCKHLEMYVFNFWYVICLLPNTSATDWSDSSSDPCG